MLLVFCGLNPIPVQHTNSGGLEHPRNSSRAVKAALGSVLAVSPAGLCTTEQKGAPRFSDSHMGQLSAGGEPPGTGLTPSV